MVARPIGTHARRKASGRATRIQSIALALPDRPPQFNHRENYDNDDFCREINLTQEGKSLKIVPPQHSREDAEIEIQKREDPKGGQVIGRGR